MKRLFFLLAIIVLAVAAQAQTTFKKGIIVNGDTIPNSELAKIPEIGGKVSTADLVTPTSFDTLNITAKATAPTMPAGTNTTDVATTAFVQTATAVNFTITSNPISFAAPLDATNYYYGGMGGLGLSETAAAARQITLPVNCTLVAWSFETRPGSAAASTEQFSLYVRKNNTTDQLLSSTLALAGAFGVVYAYGTGLTTEYSAGDKIELKITTPTWATNPNNWVVSTTLYFKIR